MIIRVCKVLTLHCLKYWYQIITFVITLIIFMRSVNFFRRLRIVLHILYWNQTLFKNMICWKDFSLMYFVSRFILKLQVRSQHATRCADFLVNELKVCTTKEAEERIFFISAKEALLARLREKDQKPASCK